MENKPLPSFGKKTAKLEMFDQIEKEIMSNYPIL